MSDDCPQGNQPHTQHARQRLWWACVTGEGRSDQWGWAEEGAGKKRGECGRGGVPARPSAAHDPQVA